MKKAVFPLIVLFLVFGCGQKVKVIVNPEYDSTNAANWIQFSKIELTDTATIVSADVYHLPNYWVFVSSQSSLNGASGKVYKLLRSEGFELDKEVYMPESGTMSFTLYFEPVDKNEKMVDFRTIDPEGESHIDGIKLYHVKHTEPVQCKLSGEVIDRPQSSRLVLLKSGEDERVNQVNYIPIHNGKFEYTLCTDAEGAFDLVFSDELQQGSMRLIEFIAEPGAVHFTLYKMDEWQNNIVKGGKYNEAYQAMMKNSIQERESLYKPLNEKRELLFKEGKLFTPEYEELCKQIEQTPYGNPARNSLLDRLYKMQSEGKDLTPEAAALQEEDIQIARDAINKQLIYAKEHPDIVGYTLLKENIYLTATGGMGRRLNLDPAPMLAIFHDIYEKKYPHHPYTQLIKSCLQASEVKEGKPFPDISATDANGKDVKISELIAGKIALVHLWASWCGPCRRHGKEMIPIYEMYKDKGFTVVGIAREKNESDMKTALERDQYPWVNLLELNDRHKIWTILGIGNAGGADFLVDENGRFLSIGATPETVKKILEEKYSK